MTTYPTPEQVGTLRGCALSADATITATIETSRYWEKQMIEMLDCEKEAQELFIQGAFRGLRAALIRAHEKLAEGEAQLNADDPHGLKAYAKKIEEATIP